jgi:head-tail adaptor
MAGVVANRKGAGERRHQLALQQGVAVTDALGGRSQAWVTYGTVRAAVESVPFVVSELQATVQFTVTMRYRADVVTKYRAGTQQRLVGAGQTLKVLAVVNQAQRNRDLVLHCAPA